MKSVKAWSNRDNIFPKKIAKLIKTGYLTKDLEPIKCTKCQSTDLMHKPTDSIGPLIINVTCKCDNCNKILGKWSI